MNVEINVDELCSLRADLRALMEENEQVRGQGKVTCEGRTALEWHNYCTAAQAVHNIELNELKEKMSRQETLGKEFVSLLNKRKQEAAQLVRGWAIMI